MKIFVKGKWKLKSQKLDFHPTYSVLLSAFFIQLFLHYTFHIKFCMSLKQKITTFWSGEDRGAHVGDQRLFHSSTSFWQLPVSAELNSSKEYVSIFLQLWVIFQLMHLIPKSWPQLNRLTSSNRDGHLHHLSTQKFRGHWKWDQVWWTWATQS